MVCKKKGSERLRKSELWRVELTRDQYQSGIWDVGRKKERSGEGYMQVIGKVGMENMDFGWEEGRRKREIGFITINSFAF